LKLYRRGTFFFALEMSMLPQWNAAKKVTCSAAAVALLAGCAATPMGPTVNVMPGPGKTFEVFQIDQANCKSFAESQVAGQAQATNNQAVGGAALGTLLGAGLGAGIGAATGNAGAGAAIGAAAGLGTGAAYGAGNTGNAQYSIQVQYDNAFSQCMYAKGELVPGYAPIAQPTMYRPTPAAPVADPMVRATQQELIRLGLLNGGADGVMGPRTSGAISNFEQAHGLPVDGAPSPRLLGILQATP